MSDETLRPEPTEAIDLARRKSRDVGREAREAVVRASLLGAKRAAAPYVTMARIVGVELGRSRLARAGALVLACLALVAIFADVIASDVACGALDPRVREALFRRRGGEGHAA